MYLIVTLLSHRDCVAHSGCEHKSITWFHKFLFKSQSPRMPARLPQPLHNFCVCEHFHIVDPNTQMGTNMREKGEREL